ncbi:MAG: AAA family ATPase [Vicinamibacterales bacterium]
MAIKQLHVAGYRSLRELRLELTPLNVITGPNGSGKTNLYQAILLLAKTALGGFARAIGEEGGMASVFWAGARRSRSVGSARSSPVRLRIAIKTAGFSYEFCCGLPQQTRETQTAFKLDPEIKYEQVSTDLSSKHVTLFERSSSGTWIRDVNGRRASYSGTLGSNEGVLSQLQEPHLYPELFRLRQEITGWRFYHQFDTTRESALRLPQIGVRTPFLAHDGSDLAAALQTIIEDGNSDELREALSRAFRGANLNIETVSGRFSILLSIPGISRPLGVSELSDGTLRYLCLIAALMSPRKPPLLAFNEPETSLHSDLLDGLARMIVEASKYSQVWITTHSAQLARLIEQHSSFRSVVLDLVDGETRLVAHKSHED